MPTFREDIKLGTKVPLIKKDDIDNFVVTDAEIKDGTITKEKLADSVLDSKNIKHEGKVSSSDNVYDAIEDLTDSLASLKDVPDTIKKLEDSKFDKKDVSQERGNSVDKVMSQKAVTDEINSVIEMFFDTPFSLSVESSNGNMFSPAMINKIDSDGNYIPFTELSVNGYWYNRKVTDKLYNIAWTRESDFPEDDKIWNLRHKDVGISLPLDFLDIGGAKYKIGTIYFKCEAEYNHVGNKITASQIINL